MAALTVRNVGPRIVQLQLPGGLIVPIPPLSQVTFTTPQEIAYVNVYVTTVLAPLVESGELVVKEKTEDGQEIDYTLPTAAEAAAAALALYLAERAEIEARNNPTSAEAGGST